MTRRKIGGISVIAVALAVVFAFVASGCNITDKRASPSSAFCGYVVGNGKDKNDNNRHYTLLPGETKDYNSDAEIAKYIPCNPRNYYVAPEDSDRKTPSLARTTDGTEVKVWTRMYWRLNQSEVALNNFFDVCAKFTCFSDQPVGGQANSSTPGWNDMLGETHSPTIDQAAFAAVSGYTTADGPVRKGFNDDIWKKPSQAQYDRLATNMAEIWMMRVQAKTGFNIDLFCGSSSAWVGKGRQREYKCNSVLFEIATVEPVKKKLQETAEEETQADQETALKRKQRANGEIVYGEQASSWLGVLDAIDACKEAGQTCIINIGGAPPVVSVPQKAGKSG